MAEDENKLGNAEAPDPGTEEKECKKWEGVINRTQQWRDKTADKAKWKKFINAYKGDWEWKSMGIDPAAFPVVPLNLVFAWVKTEMARLYFQNPWITTNAKRVEDVGAAHIAEQVLNYTWQEIDLKRQMKLALLDALLVGHGWVKVGYTATFGIQEHKEALKRGPGRPKKEPLQIDTNEFVRSENVFAVHYPWDQVIFDPGATWPAHHNARWIAFRWVKPLRAVKESGLYKEDAVTELKAIKPTGKGESPGTDVENAQGYEIWDKDTRKVVTVSPGVKKYLREVDWPEEFLDREGNPFFPAAILSFNPVPGEAYPYSDIDSFYPLCEQLMKLQAMQVNHLKRHNRQILMPVGTMTEEQKKKYERNEDGSVVEIQGDPSKITVPQYPQMQSDVYQVVSQLRDWFRLISGQSETEQGAPARTGTRTMYELRQVLQGNHNRAEERLDVLEDFCSEIARKVLNVIQKKFDLPKIARIVGNKAMDKALMSGRPSAQPAPEGAPPMPKEQQPVTTDFAFSWTGQDVMGDMDVDTLAGSTVPLNKENQLALLEKLGPVIPFFGIGPGSPAARALGREIFRLIDIKSLEPIMDLADQQSQHPQPNPAQMKAQMEMQKGQMKMQAEKAKSDLQLKAQQAKTQADLLKAQVDIAKTKQEMQHDTLKHALSQFMPPPMKEEVIVNGNQSD